jgi:hypothetical protein
MEWQLKQKRIYSVECCECEWEDTSDDTYEGSEKDAIAEFKRKGWQLKANGPWCPECVLSYEIRMDDSEVYPK